jgi:hypothetical protein
VNLVEIFLLAVAAAFYPTLLGVVILILGRDHAQRLLAFFLAGALLVSLAVGLTAVFVVDAAHFHTSPRTVHGPLNIVAGLIALLIGVDLFRPSGKDDAAPKKEKGPSMSQRALSRDSTRIAFVLGIVLDLPSLWYVLGLKDIVLGGYGAVQKVLLVLAFNLNMFSFIEVPLVAYVASPELTQQRVRRFNDWLHRHGRRVGAYIAIGAGVALVIRGVVAVT